MPTTDIYDKRDRHFANVSAYVIHHEDAPGVLLATTAIKFPKDGAGRLYAYVHWFGLRMVRGHAGGYGYDKRSAAVSAAAKLIPHHPRADAHEEDRFPELRAAFLAALAPDDGCEWNTRLELAGFIVWRAV